MTSERLLFDVPGPKARRRTIIWSIISVIGIVAVIAAMLVQLARNDQMQPEQWHLFIERTALKFLGEGLLNTLKAAFAAGLIALPIAIIAAAARMSTHRTQRAVATVYIEVMRAIPVLLLIYVFVLLLPNYGIRISLFWQLAIPLVFTNSAALAEIFRSGINALEFGQSEAAYAIGLTRGQAMRYVLVPQAVRHVLPSLVSQMIYLFKGTTLGYVVSYTELLQQGKIYAEAFHVLLQTYVVIAFIYVVINASLAKLARVVDDRQRRVPS
ncbi:amino acid ABC transporter permease [Spelaeicoccus albus]|uniref:Glutamate transport system permease protein n=1 Tax=Spelaeicoccus albus TaxID=1280376 RepID=A0A7Z0A863_9MICO|nr:amino acid ABC transporter permease [Spelaeicoccus albus]NYI66217.1 glutamate transport system permease protein [Spelaeicoccus albus]